MTYRLIIVIVIALIVCYILMRKGVISRAQMWALSTAFSTGFLVLIILASTSEQNKVERVLQDEVQEALQGVDLASFSEEEREEIIASEEEIARLRLEEKRFPSDMLRIQNPELSLSQESAFVIEGGRAGQQVMISYACASQSKGKCVRDYYFDKKGTLLIEGAPIAEDLKAREHLRYGLLLTYGGAKYLLILKL